MKIPFLDLKAQYITIKDEIAEAIASVCDEQSFILGPQVKQFEKDIEKYYGIPHAIGVASGSDALLLSLMAFGIGPGDEVLTTPFTFFATAGSIWRLGAKPVFVDIDPISFNISPEKLRKKITKRTKAVIPVHLFGQEVNPETFAVCKSDLFMKSEKGEDAERIAFGSTLSNDRHAGSGFDYLIANPPYGKDWRRDEDAVRTEHERGGRGVGSRRGVAQVPTHSCAALDLHTADERDSIHRAGIIFHHVWMAAQFPARHSRPDQ
jgi:hypothetical protein